MRRNRYSMCESAQGAHSNSELEWPVWVKPQRAFSDFSARVWRRKNDPLILSTSSSVPWIPPLQRVNTASSREEDDDAAPVDRFPGGPSVGGRVWVRGLRAGRQASVIRS